MIEICAVNAFDLATDLGYDEDGWEDLSRWFPARASFVSLVLTLSLGCRGMAGTNDFAIVVVTKDFLKSKGVLAKPKYIMEIDEFKWTMVKRLLIDRVRSCESATWVSTLEQLRSKFYWEFEDGKLFETSERN